MGYATRQDIEALYGAAWLETLVPADVDMDVAVQHALDQATALMDGYLMVRYSVPLPVIPELLKTLAIDIACWKLTPSAAGLTDEISNRARMAIATLKDIAAGKMVVPGLEDSDGTGGALPDDGQAGAASDGAAYFSNPRRFPTGGGLL